MLKTLDQSLKLLQLFTKEKPEWGARELAKEVGLNHANVFRVLSTFEANRFLEKDPKTKKYSLGIRLWELGLTMRESFHVSRLIRPVLQRMMEESGESIFLTCLDEDEALTLDALEPDNVVKYSVSVGSRAPLFVGASYRSIMAYLPQEKIEHIILQGLRQYTKNTIADPDKLREELVHIREAGWAMSTGEYTPDVLAIACPLFHYDGHVMGSLTISGPIYRMSEEKKAECLEILMRGKREVDEIIQNYRVDLSRYYLFG
ncbi:MULTISPECIES: IclR family transcriptional regulator [Brevibacillus]|uniref:Transcriptional regulator n=1 Tax=Brevibacillus parabrevis TaxID=54914 RepID=A0A4Y3PQ64_BREPA|nr:MULTISPECIES: IclR family transcriptional regulator [Brevibacillus]NRQ55735.1 IclR family transcriptional regulator [Brevibacillus sp. HD1.4A]RNB95060.1 IclR family transcriptional regulator [Brevibacillus parabrevis]UED68071.1 IclR family transcriptional regulator [Brevibacillus sp. HD3.3A]WDV94348.1 IclR family transcriptional regulator [Brevibacillus parabrevis]GEB34116.1 transcriptional regulator [Brevibacillus parabrevis]